MSFTFTCGACGKEITVPKPQEIEDNVSDKQAALEAEKRPNKRNLSDAK